MAIAHPIAVAGFLLVALAAPVATIIALSGSGAAIAVAVVAWAAFAAYWLRAPRIWGEVEAARGRAAVVGGTVASSIAFVLGFLANYWITVEHDLCGTDAFGWIIFAVALGAYLVAGAVLLRQASRLLWLWPALVLAMWGIALVLRAVAPGSHGLCET